MTYAALSSLPELQLQVLHHYMKSQKIKQAWKQVNEREQETLILGI